VGAAPAAEVASAAQAEAYPAEPDLGGPDPFGADPFGADLDGADLDGADLDGAAPAGAAPSGADPAEADFFEDFTENDFKEGFTGAEFTENDFTENDDFTEPRTDSGPVSKLAIVSLVTGVVALVPIAVPSGIAALIGIRRTGRGGHGMAMAGLCLAAAWVIIAAAIGTVGLLTHGFHKPVTVKYREAAVFTLHEGDCVDSPNGKVVSVLPCSDPHEAEVFARFALAGSRWPGTAAIASEASSGCGSRLDSYLNPQLAISLSQSYVYPNQVAWTAGTRTVICEVRATSGLLTGSVRGGSLAAPR